MANLLPPAAPWTALLSYLMQGSACRPVMQRQHGRKASAGSTAWARGKNLSLELGQAGCKLAAWCSGPSSCFRMCMALWSPWRRSSRLWTKPARGRMLGLSCWQRSPPHFRRCRPCPHSFVEMQHTLLVYLYKGVPLLFQPCCTTGLCAQVLLDGAASGQPIKGALCLSAEHTWRQLVPDSAALARRLCAALDAWPQEAPLPDIITVQGFKILHSPLGLQLTVRPPLALKCAKPAHLFLLACGLPASQPTQRAILHLSTADPTVLSQANHAAHASLRGAVQPDGQARCGQHDA